MDLSDLEELDFASWSIRCCLLDNYDAAFGTEVEFEASPGVLTVKGAIVDTVKTTAINTVDSVQQETSTSNDFLDEVLKVADIPPEFWLSMLAGTEPDIQVLPTQINVESS